MLAHWIGYYVTIYDLPYSERPAEYVINDDDLLDEWVAKKSKETGDKKTDDTNLTEYKASKRFE